ncbi:MAG: threonine synthase [Treponema sp.]|jgi:threonine synthase|nr:threonine synthase [Treponema sp.]
MQFRSTKSPGPLVSFKDAVLHCLPSDGGLYVPDRVMDIRQFFLYMGEKTSFHELVATVAPSLLQGELNPFSASRVAESAFDFEPELIRLDEGLSILNLYNGPTGLFKDFGIAFLAAVMEELLKNSGQALVLAAAKGDTGASMAHAFSKQKGFRMVLVYPSGPVRGLKPASFVSNGGNIIPIQIKGTFDDCQRLINEAINDRKFAERFGITSANAINPGRLLPQTFYYLYTFIKIKKHLSGDLAFSVPSGNFGNLIAGLYAWKFGMPVNAFIAAMNANNAFGDFIQGKPFVSHPLINTNSPALDVSVPSNYERLASFYKEAPAVMRNMVYPASISDESTLSAIEYAWKKYNILIDSHTAVAFAAARQVAEAHTWSGHVHTVVLATGHPAKEADLMREITGQDIDIPKPLSVLQRKTDPIAVISPQLDAFEGVIASCY